MTVGTDASPREIVRAVRAASPLVHCLTNDVTAGRVADALAALGALPVMATAPEEAEEIAAAADAVVLNCGTPSQGRWVAMRAVAAVAARRGIPVVLDPVGVGASSWRAANAREIAALAHASVRGNAPEVAALAGVPGAGELRGVTAVGVGADRVLPLALAASAALRTAVLVSGPVDAAADGDRSRSAAGAPPRYPALGLGDVLGAVAAAFACVERDRLGAMWSAREVMAEAVRAAGAAAPGPGSFWPALIDALARA